MPARLHARRLFSIAALFLAIALKAEAAPPPVDAFLKSRGVEDIALSPDGAWLAAVQRATESEHVVGLMVYRVEGAGLVLHKSAKLENVRVYDLAWANRERLLATMQKYDPKTGSALKITATRITWQPPQVVAMNPNLENSVALLKDERDFIYTVDRSEILHWLPWDPKHILMEIYDSRGRQGLNIYKVNVYDGKAELVERGSSNTRAWMVDAMGNVRLKVERRGGGWTVWYARNTPQEDWFEIARFRRREIPNILPLAFSSDPNILYVASRHQGDRQAVYEYKMRERALGRLVFAHPKVDVAAALFTMPESRLIGFRYVIHKPQAHYLDETLQRFDSKLERSFGAENFARPVSRTQDGRLMVIGVTGPRDPGSYYLYDTAANKANLIGVQARDLSPEQMGVMKPVTYTARDGAEITAYLTTPPGNPPRPPLVVMPHGGPEVRDYLTWDPWAQFLATRGYAVLQPNFRGSDGYGKKFAEAGYKQWGLKMQDDITDGVRHVAAQGLVDVERICIFGASYGGYTALAGAAFTPDLYKCAISINGIGDLYDMMNYERKRGTEYHYWVQSVGDPRNKTDSERMKRLSPTRNVDKIRIPILLVAGAEDDNVEVSQSRDMAKALKKAGKPHEYIEFKDEGHNIDDFENRKRMLLAAEQFLQRNIGAARPAETAAR